MARQVLPPPTGVSLLPDVPNWSWHEYGMRVGFWRFHALYQSLKIKPTVAINGAVCVDYPRVAPGRARMRAGSSWPQLRAGNRSNNEKDQPGMIRRCLDTIGQFTGKRPVGWLGPGLTETYDTPEHLTAAGIKYIGDWVYDDEPTEIATANGPLVTLPYNVECNDIPMMIIQHHEAAYWTQKCIDTFERLYQEAPTARRLCDRHPPVHQRPAVPHQVLEEVYARIAKFKGVLHWNGEQILEWYSRARTAA